MSRPAPGGGSLFILVMVMVFGLIMALFGIATFYPETSLTTYLLIGGGGLAVVALVWKWVLTPGDDEDVSEEATTGLFALLKGIFNWRVVLAIIVLVIVLILLNGVMDFTGRLGELWPSSPSLPDLPDLNPFGRMMPWR